MSTLKRPDGTKIYYKLVGKDTGRLPLVMIHGWCSRHELWEHQVRYFKKDHRILLLDRRGHGRSTTSGDGHDALGHAADIAAVTKAAGLKRVVAIGHAGGGPGTLEFVRANPRLVRAGIMVDALLYPQPKLSDPKSAFGMLLGPMLEQLRGPKSKSVFRAWYTSFFDPKGDRAAIKAVVADAAKVPNEIKIIDLEGIVLNTATIADKIRQPMLWLTAAVAEQEYIKNHLRNVAFAQVYGASHFPQFEQPEQTNAMIDAFISRL